MGNTWLLEIHPLGNVKKKTFGTPAGTWTNHRNTIGRPWIVLGFQWDFMLYHA